MKAFGLGALVALVLPLGAQQLADLQKEVTDFKLTNGFHFTVAERHGAPVVAFNTYIVVGSVNDPAGQSGLARLMGRMLLKGTESIGSKNPAAEKQAMQNVEAIYDEFEAARSRPYANALLMEALDAKLKNAIEQAESFAQAADWAALIDENGGAHLGVSTSVSHTEYHYSLPSNRAELWFLLESQHLLHPAFREFYKERDAAMQENKAQQNNLQSKLAESFAAAAFETSPYRNPVNGWSTDLPQLRVSEAKAFYEKYYTPSDIEIGIAGDISTADAKRWAEKYFGPIPARTAAAAVRTLEPVQPGPKTVTIAASQPMLLVGYKRPAQYDKDDLVFDILGVVLASNRAGALYRELVEQKRVASSVEVKPTHPDGRWTSLFVFQLQPAAGRKPDEVTKALEASLAQFSKGQPDEQDLTRAKSKIRSSVMDQLDSNEGLASILPHYVADFGDWKRLAVVVEQLNKVTAGDLQRVAARYFRPEGQTVAIAEAR